jgi:hypothetical protein
MAYGLHFLAQASGGCTQTGKNGNIAAARARGEDRR